MKSRTLLIVAVALVAGFLFLRSQNKIQLPWNSSPITVPGGHYGGGQ